MDEREEVSKILIIDDDAGIRLTMTDIFEDQGFKVDTAATGREGQEKFDSFAPDVVLLDIRLPDADGTALFSGFKEKRPEIIGVFITGHANLDNARKAVHEGATGYYVKPFDPAEVIRAIEDALGKLRLELEVLENAERLNSIVEASSDAIITVDAHQKIVQWNSAARDIFGYGDNEALGREYHDLLRLEQIIEKALNGSGRSIHEACCQRRDGERRLLEMNSGFWRKNEKQFETLIIRDVTELRRKEEEKQKLQSQLRQAQKLEAIGTLAGGIAHDFNNILAAIIGYGELMLDDLPEDSKAQRDLEQILKAGDRAKGLVRQILTFSRQTEHEKIPVQLHLILKEAMQLLRASIPANVDVKQNIIVRDDLVLADPVQLHQIIMNLCTNAYQSMEGRCGTVLVELAAKNLTAREADRLQGLLPGKYLVLTVRDTGSGMAPDVLESVFEPYFSTKAKGEGTGLGLSVVHGIVTDLKGRIEVESEVGRGSVFTVYFPHLDQKAEQSVVDDACLPRGDARILVVDDEKMILEMTGRMLEQLGYTVSLCSSSSRALEQFVDRPSSYDLALLDQCMPQMTGIDLAVRINEIRPEMPVIMMTGYPASELDMMRGSSGIRKIMIKPLRRMDLALALYSVLKGAGGKQADKDG